MLSKKTTFIVGAGASKSYGLPIAWELYRHATKLTAGHEVYQLLLCCSVDGKFLDPSELNETIRDLREHGGPSIDQFIQHRQHLSAGKVGKLLLAALLGHAIKNNVNNPPRASDIDDWIGHVFRIVSAGISAADFAKTVAQNLRFVTFNFDSVIEQRAQESIRRIYRGHSEVGSAVESLNVHHVHGLLTKLPEEHLYIGPAPRHGYTGSGVSGAWVQWTMEAAERIHLTQDEIPPSDLDAARVAVEGAEVLCFLGFRFEDDNVAKLWPRDASRLRDVMMFGSCYKVAAGDQTRIASLCEPGEIKLGSAEGKCLQLLNDFYVLR